MVTLEYILNYCRIDIEPEDEAYKCEIKLIQDCILAAESYLKNATGKEYPDMTDREEYAQERIFLATLISDMYEKRSPTIPANTSEVYKGIVTQLQLK